MRPIECEQSGSSGSSGSVGLSPSEQLLMQTMQSFFHDLFWGSSQQEEKSRQIEIERERKRIQEQMEYRRQREEQKRKEFEKSKERMLGLMRGSGTGTLKPREVASLPELEVHEKKDAFGIKTLKPLKPRDLSNPTQVTKAGQDGSPSFKINCSSFLMQKAKEASAAGRFEDASYLSNEAANLISGAQDSPGVVCPPPPEVPAVEGVPLGESKEQAEKVKKETVVMSRLYSRASQQVADYRVILNSVAQEEQKVREAQTRVKEARAQKEKLETQIKQSPKEAADSEISERHVPFQSTDNQSAMQEALEALRQAEAALEESEQELAGYMEEKAQLEEHVKGTRDLFMQATKNPEKLNELYDEFSSEPEKGNQR